MHHRAASLEIEGRPHPLLVAIRNSAYPLLESLFQQPRLPGPGRLLEEVVAHRVSPAELGLDPEQAKQLVFDVDTPKDLETAISMHLRHLF
jgi:molybdopterin-guanine dinucleotide biosynthesis protein A